MRFKSIVLLFTLLLALLLLAACGSSDTAEPAANDAPAAEEAPAVEEAAPAAAESKVFKVGVLGPFTGPSARTGEEFKVAAEMALEKINYQIGDYTIEPVWVDSQSDPEKATRAYEEAIVQDGIQAGVLNWHSSVAVAVMEITAKYQVPHFFGFGATEVVNEKFASDPEKYGYWTTKGWPTPDKLSQNYVTALEDAIAAGTWVPEAKTAVIYGEDTDWGRSFGDGIAAQLEAAGWEIKDYQYFPIEQTEFYPLLNKFKDLNVALIAGTSTAPPSLSAFIKQADEVGIKSLIIADGLGWVGEWYELTGDSSNYVLDQIPGWTTDESLKFAADFEAKSGIAPSPSSGGLSYDGMNFFIKVLQTAYDDYGELTKETVFDTVKNKVWTGELTFTTADGAIVMSNYDFSNPPDPIVGKGFYTFPVLQYMDGEGLYVWPPEFQNTDLQAKP
ncbi:MAG: ABC transporter substrate-binding protein [Ardenticatenaceae bacterium]|nr:ABC transporter substrate-binding protein [Ardenticatenaceae bacterium]MCB9442920.1 ABC transporter substrate-binding protein [Ardenticatenaceae bacterium]